MADVIFKDNRSIIIREMEDSIDGVLLEVSAELVSQTARNTRVKSSQTKNSWAANVNKTANGYEAVIGSPLENAIWEEFGTGEHALKGNGRKGGWFYVDEKGKGHFTHGKKPSRAFWHAYTSLKSAIIKRIQNSLKGL